MIDLDTLKASIAFLHPDPVYRVQVFTAQLAWTLGLSHRIRLRDSYRCDLAKWERRILANTVRQWRMTRAL